MKIDDILAKHIGDLTVENVKLKLAVQALKMEIAKRDKLIADLNATEPELPIPAGKDHLKEFRNGAH